MNNFKNATLNDISIGNKGNYGIGAKSVEYSKDLYTYLRITDINNDGTIDKKNLKSVDDPQTEKYLLKPNDIVFARTGGSTGRNYFYDGSDGKLVYAGFLIKFSIDEKKVNPKYVKYYCISNDYKSWVKSFNTGSTRGNINAKTFGEMNIPLPDRKQQNLLVDTLTCLDDKIEINNKINEKLEEMAQAIFKSWFVDFEPFKDGEFIDSELGPIPKGWRVDQVKNQFDVSIGKTPPRKESKWFSNKANDITWVSISDMRSCGTYISKSSENLTKDAIDKFNVVVVPNNTVILSFKLTVGRVAITDREMTTNEAIAHFKTVDETITEFIYLYLKTFNYKSLGSTSSIATAVNSKIIKSMQIIIPDKLILKNFHETVYPLMLKIKNNQREIEDLTKIRDSLLPKLMSGEIDVSNIQKH